MISRYVRPEMGAEWEPQARWDRLLEVEVAVAVVQGRLKIIPAKAAREISKKAAYSLTRIEELERTTKHDVIAFVSSVAESVGPMGRYVHFGLTSSDALDTATSLQIARAGKILLSSFTRLENSLRTLALKHAGTLCAGRTHGMHAEVTSFGYKVAGHLAEFSRARGRVTGALKQMRIAKLSGAVGTFTALPRAVELAVGQELDLIPETVATQVIPRDRHAEMLWSLAITGAAIERLAVELRHLQRSEVGEAIENFSSGQKGSSAMPHKKNPIGAENLTGLARLLRANASTALENVALWHERDISHSSVERVILPDSFMLADYALDRMAGLIDGLYVDADRMARNLELSKGNLFSSQVLLALVSAGLTREKAYALVQTASHAVKAGESLLDSLLRDAEVGEALSKPQLKQIFSGKTERLRLTALTKRAVGQIHRRARGTRP